MFIQIDNIYKVNLDEQIIKPIEDLNLYQLLCDE